MRVLLCFILAAHGAFAGGPVRFRITLDPSLWDQPVSGRMLVFLTNSQQHRERLGTGFGPGDVWVAAMEVERLAPGGSIVLDPDRKAFPRPFSEAPAGDHQAMALLDPDHSYARTRQNEGDLYSLVIAVKGLDPASAEPVPLTLTRRTAGRPKPADTANVKLVEYTSDLLSAFWGRPITMRAGVVLPPGYHEEPSRRYPACYVVHGFGGNHLAAWREKPRTAMVRVYLDGSFPSGHHEFADSANNGPWGRALTEEFIPHLEKLFRLIAAPHARFLTGHSSGGWSTLWLQVSYPEFFGGTWSTAPDPVDFRSFTGIDATPGSTQNAYRTRDGKPLNLVRNRASFEDFVRHEEVLGDYGGQIASFEWVFSPRGEDGRPMRLFDRATGEMNRDVQRAWMKYDIRGLVEAGWGTLGPKLLGKLRIICGAEDTFHLEEAVAMMCDFLKSKGREEVCEIVPGRDHGNLYDPYRSYPDGLAQRIDDEMRARFEAARPGR
ncbi:MAG: alpha/beta hydrolase-fold protein [Bryobacterales bacterium]|nr:alpha/beta hydrolase-fold protein [Bryobacterales bacterium]